MKNTSKLPTNQLEKFSTVFTQLGLVLVLFIVYVTLEHQTEIKAPSSKNMSSTSARVYIPDEPMVIISREPKEIIKLKVPKTEAIAQAEAILNKVGLWEKRDQYPAFLSGGQQQRAAIARALAINPKVMLFDEPTSALDPELVGEVLKVIRDLADEGNTMILVTHEMKFARDVSSHVIYLHQGLIEEEGPPKELFYNPTSERCRTFVSSIH